MNARQLFSHWDRVRRGLFAALDMVDDEQLHYIPRKGLWSLGQVACHIANGELHWFQYYVEGRMPEDFEPYNLDACPTVQDVKRALEQVHSETLALLDTWGLEDLDRKVRLPWGAETTLGYAVWHIFEHEIHHRGEIFLMLGMLGMEAPDI